MSLGHQGTFPDFDKLSIYFCADRSRFELSYETHVPTNKVKLLARGGTFVTYYDLVCVGNKMNVRCCLWRLSPPFFCYCSLPDERPGLCLSWQIEGEKQRDQTLDLDHVAIIIFYSSSALCEFNCAPMNTSIIMATFRFIADMGLKR